MTTTDQTLSEAIAQSLGHLTGEVLDLRAVLTAPSERSLSVLTTSAVADASGTALITFDPVPRGEHWELRRLVVGGATWATAAAGTSIVFATSGQPSSTPPLGAVLDQATSLPDIAFYLAGQALLTGGERLVVAVTGGTADQQYLAAVQLVAKPD